MSIGEKPQNIVHTNETVTCTRVKTDVDYHPCIIMSAAKGKSQKWESKYKAGNVYYNTDLLQNLQIITLYTMRKEYVQFDITAL